MNQPLPAQCPARMGPENVARRLPKLLGVADLEIFHPGRSERALEICEWAFRRRHPNLWRLYEPRFRGLPHAEGRLTRCGALTVLHCGAADVEGDEGIAALLSGRAP